MKLENTKVLVIGGGSGIGFAVARACVDEGAVVTIASTNPEKLKSAAAKLGGVTSVQLDITNESAVEAYFKSSDPFDHIVSTAGDWGKARRAAIDALDLASAESLFGVRFWGAVAVAKHGATRLPPGGSLTLTGGMSAHRPQKGSAIATAMAGSVEHQRPRSRLPQASRSFASRGRPNRRRHE
jgi:NAD(P)-dependent dehydrogenase (short-subunit alcohol dehydrogenase family)